MKDTFDIWMNRASFLVTLGIAPWKYTQKSKPIIHLLAILFGLIWFVAGIYLWLALCIPAIICAMMAIRHIGE